MSRPLLVLILALAYTATAATAAAPRDRDHDRLPDRWERKHHLSTKHGSARRDPDRDGLTNRRELRLHTHPRRADTDRDGLRDGPEVRRFHTKPRKRDTDGDGFGDGAEVRAGTDPRNRASHPSRGLRPAPGPAGCVGGRNTAGGADPWGGCFPGPSNTGTPDNVALTNYRGPCTINSPNTVIAAKTVNCDLDINATGVAIRNSRVNGSIDTSNSGSLTISDSTVDAGEVNSNVNDGPRALNGSNFTAIRVEAVRGISGGFCEVNCELRDSWIHGQDRDEGGHAHESGFRMENRTHVVHSSIACDAPSVAPDAGCSADLTGYGDFATIQNNLIERNLFLPTTGGFCAYGGSTSSKPFSNGNNNVFRENIFKRGPSGKCGVYGAITDLDGGARGNQWIDNRWDSGQRMRSDG